MPTLFSRGTNNRLPDGVYTREYLFDQAEHAWADGNSQDIGIAFMRLSNVGTYSRLVGTRETDNLITAFFEVLSKRLGKKAVIANDGHASALALVPREQIAHITEDLAREIATRSNEVSIELRAGWCGYSPDYDARGAVERARFAYNDIAFEDRTVVRFFDDVEGSYNRRRYVVDHLDDAIARGEIRAYAQPIVRILTGRVSDVEILARWESEAFGTIYPSEFVPLLEEFRQIHKLDVAIINLACAQWAEARAEGIAVPFGINLSRLDFELCDIYQVVREVMRAHNVPVHMVHVEVTESASTGREDVLRAGIRRFREAGFRIYMDDYGTGYSSLSGLLDNNYDVMKLDKSLIDDIETNERSRVLVADAISMAKRLGMQTLCEGIESLEQLLFLKMVGCEKGQGYFFGKPISHERVMERLRSESDHYEEEEYGDYLDAIGRVNLVDGTNAETQGVEAAVFLDNTPVAITEATNGHIYLLENNVAFDDFLRKIGVASYEEAVEKISAGDGLIRKRFAYAASFCKETGKSQTVDFVLGGFFSTVTLSHVASTPERDAYLIKASTISSSFDIGRQHNLEQAAPFLYSTYKRIDLFDLETGASTNLYLSAPLLRNRKMAGLILSEIREFCDINIHPEDRPYFMDFYDLATLNQRIEASGGNHVSSILRTRAPEGGYSDHIYTLIPMTISGKRQVLSTCRAIDSTTESSHLYSGDARISDADLLKAVLEGTDRYVFWKDTKRRFLGANQAFLDYYGFSSIDEILGKTDDEVGWHVDNKPFRDDELRVLAGETILRARGTCYDRNELRKIEANKRPIIVSGRIVGLLGYFRDLGPAEEERRPS